MPSKDRAKAVFPVLSETPSILGPTVGNYLGKVTEAHRNGSLWHWELLKLMLTGYRVSRENPLYLSDVVVDRTVRTPST